MDEARVVLKRLERIEALDREHATPAVILAELRELVREAEQWVRVEGDERAAEATRSCRHALAPRGDLYSPVTTSW
jgi:hypothetical protein